jgi:hypothetical protein
MSQSCIKRIKDKFYFANLMSGIKTQVTETHFTAWVVVSEANIIRNTHLKKYNDVNKRRTFRNDA